MWEIYKCAEQVLIWLGEPSSEVSTVPGWSSLLSRALRRPEDINRIKRNRANKEYSDNRRDRRRGSRPLPCEHGHYMTAQEATEDARREIRSSAEDGELQLIREILALPWFRRRWIVQEVLFSCRTIALYGYHDFDFYDLLPAAMIFQKDHALIPQVLAGAKKTYQDQGVLRIMHDFDGHDCTDARDKVYAMMRLSSDFYLAPDYTATVESVYIDTARSFIETGHLEELLALASCRASSPCMPLWAPDWRHRPEYVSAAHAYAVDSLIRVPHIASTTSPLTRNGSITAECFVWPACKIDISSRVTKATCISSCLEGNCLACDLQNLLNGLFNSCMTGSEYQFQPGETSGREFHEIQARKHHEKDKYRDQIDTIVTQARSQSSFHERLICVFASQRAAFVMTRLQSDELSDSVDSTSSKPAAWSPHCCLTLPSGDEKLSCLLEAYPMTSVVIG
jgi:hypothetical protein